MIHRRPNPPTLTKKRSTDGELPYERNHILSKLNPADRKQLGLEAELVRLTPNDVMYEVEERLESMWFPVSGMISIVSDTDSSNGVEVGAAGYDGMIGFEGLLGAKTSQRRQFCQIGGEAIMVPLDAAAKIFISGSGQKAFLAFLHAHIIEASQSAVCNRRHSADARLARWLLSCRDRARADKFELTHQFLSQMLGARRSTVSLSANKFKSRGWIDYTRGKIKILNAKELTKAACDCYNVVRRQQRA